MNLLSKAKDKSNHYMQWVIHDCEISTHDAWRNRVALLLKLVKLSKQLRLIRLEVCMLCEMTRPMSLLISNSSHKMNQELLTH